MIVGFGNVTIPKDINLKMKDNIFNLKKNHYVYIAALFLMLASCEASEDINSISPSYENWIPASFNTNGWKKWGDGPVLGDSVTGTCFDVNVITEGSTKYNMYFSWRPKKALALVHSNDGIHWSEPEMILEHNDASGWEDDINRSCTLYWNGQYHLWYVGQAKGVSKIGYAISSDGVHFERVSNNPVFEPTYVYEGYSVMNPYVLRDEKRGVFRMWYACGETYEPNRIGYAESTDGINWERSPLNPIFEHGTDWEKDRIGGCEVHQLPDGRYIMFYIGYSDINTAAIGAAISPDGIQDWKRLKSNPLVSPTEGYFDANSCYKPSVYRDEEKQRWQLWYNGRNGVMEYIGYAVHEGLALE